MGLTKKEREDREAQRRSIEELAALVSSVRAAVDCAIRHLDSPDPMTRVRAARLILRESNKARERECFARLDRIEQQITTAGG
jgi:Na+/phosphate symporter